MPPQNYPKKDLNTSKEEGESFLCALFQSSNPQSGPQSLSYLIWTLLCKEIGPFSGNEIFANFS